jgi:hypothetical protein
MVACACGEIDPTPGQLTLRNLRLKKGALDKFRLPVDVLEGAHISSMTSRELTSVQVILGHSHCLSIG